MFRNYLSFINVLLFQHPYTRLRHTQRHKVRKINNLTITNIYYKIVSPRIKKEQQDKLKANCYLSKYSIVHLCIHPNYAQHTCARKVRRSPLSLHILSTPGHRLAR